MSAHCQHCDPDCTGGTVYDPDDSGTRHWGHDNAFDWHDDYGCPICNDAALLRRLADEGDAQGARWDDSAALLKTYGHADEAASDARIAETHRAVAAILRAAAIEIEAGEQ